MPLFFSNKFQLPRISARKKLSFHSEREPKPRESPLVIRLGEETAQFNNGEWIPISESSRDIYQEYEALRKTAQKLKEENSFLKLKIDILLDMLTEETLKIEGVIEGNNPKHKENNLVYDSRK